MLSEIEVHEELRQKSTFGLYPVCSRLDAIHFNPHSDHFFGILKLGSTLDEQPISEADAGLSRLVL